MCCAAGAAEPAPESPARRVSPSGGRFSIEFPANPKCDAEPDQPDCRYFDPKEEWILRVSYGKAEVEGTPSAYLQRHLDRRADDESFEIKLQEPMRVGTYPALDYRLEPIDNATYRSAGRLVLVGAQLVDIEAGGDTLPPEEVIQRFVNSLRVEDPSALSMALSPPPLATLLQASLLKPGQLQYQSVQEKLPGGGLPWRFLVGTTQRKTQSQRDKKRNAFLISDTGITPAGKVQNRYWLDAKSLLPYRWEGRSPDGDSMRLELVDGVLRGERKGATPATFEQPVGDKPLLFPGAALELALSTLPLGQGFTGSFEMLDPEGLATGKPVSTWLLSVPFAGTVTGLVRNPKKEVPCFKVELLERTEGKTPRKINLWIENTKVRRVLLTELLVPAEQGEDRTLQMIQAPR
ncbi:hypothetical protein [Cystobacter ferrugineus]|uniref:Uncharacterized protein n=1 Tax=Cystobacter ferrugineus TaxID=83449 RepID=A0A1L9B2Q4_9BACT|nr:hypothetical protein [Cystobacter ferrugineus]OJH36555.1 hypothetical protein BON30_32895 [Cystobacter ferrugineus]